ncbi:MULTISPECIES: hypothetical protein [unclassified Microcoleus]|uniref:hypothetical protein n=1 Tax=unclassified Microcoleus TaxID=2642155 RepID=UPI001D43CAA5|nr:MULTISPECIES: hypothetical protein [unclassified Microcoleus]MCC3440832.1 hypothetical protein [Microcoleus sp. PH2017_03_ELD_O_A]MCC3504414.1 hypothetical protein [Microcoleus sp. PH2017_19_SFW_U_A]MCC3545199.1 hypothetical protein [Microcoleus sp. PH2017_24_DOB_U_A]TAE16016.1 MAG: hypothetical protein EAZ94_03125 [Oscillatoriales cyanobacterium]MCC3415632.1 hypothetical protein [Microcoleus sp. PH2017_02_FOX_O_A]
MASISYWCRVKVTFHQENSTKDFAPTQRSNFVQQPPSAKVLPAEGFHPIVNFQQHNHHRSPKIKFFRGKLAI